jgi:uncharacterized protein (TIGR03067 family)
MNMKLRLHSLWLGLALATRIAVGAESETAFQPIFNGKDLTGWDGNPELWSVKDGAIVGQTSAEKPLKGNSFLIWKDGTTADFELRLSYRITPLAGKGFANSGIQYRSKVLDAATWRVGGYQADFEAGQQYSGILYDEGGVAGGRGIMAARGEKVVWDKDCKKQVTGAVGKSEEIQAAIKKEGWNDYVIIAQGNHLQHFINGRLTVDVTDECESKALKSGVLALQIHAGDPMKVEFKNLRIKAGTAANPLAELNGRWTITSMESDGDSVPREEYESLSLRIENGKYWLNRPDNEDTGAFTVEAGKSPRAMDIRPDTGPGAGQTIPAIYEWAGETLRICYSIDGSGERPTAFYTAAGSGRVLVTYKRKP